MTDNVRLIQARAQYDWSAIVRLIQECFAYMEGVIDPPSSMHRLTPEGLRDHAIETGEVWVLESSRPDSVLVGCMVLTPQQDALYVGKVVVDSSFRGEGLARRLLRKAEMRALALGFKKLELQVRVELVENHRTFAALGFQKTGETAHAGFNRPTSITMSKDLSS